MLYIVLVLVLTALGLLVAALITANSLWAWISIALSVVAGLLLVFDWLRRRKKRSAESAAPVEETADDPADEAADSEEDDEERPQDAEQTVLMPTTGELGDPEEAAEPQRIGDPGEEESDPADVAIVSELETEIVVVDEYPRYHVTTCAWLETRDTIPLGIGEARQLGFTPCALCTPDAEIAGQHRDKTKADG
ncbi:hypothetical protein [Amycolatopsis regifaucium]|uniref:Uncharacterized protein n=1 Tax=Amycolatopsis regifaucium TaxID=546365 RepID=A0A154MP29_9PSEU|nr:hypothetical protein [Amycolatopsis regifaucium]KZB85733.1 hypothetical protein AVL48_30240 [Amycolatopsis regifaucium]OKA10513.1 hypothetical protein ATP06_0203665 [Amycolatopsis regifaucium]SFI80260.1 hypothetical protein SAMN04489731_113105 [Amycolatopsis regifaucium]